MIKSIDKLIKEIGPPFRGLWKSIIYTAGEKEERWSVTFLLKGEMVETPYLCTPDAALRAAIKDLNDE